MEMNEELGNRAAVYARTATAKCAGEDGSVDMQVARCLRYAAEKEYSVLPEHIWKVVGSGNDPHLGARTELMSVIGAGEVDVLLVCGVDRLSRSMIQLVYLVQAMRVEGVRLEDLEQGGGELLRSLVELTRPRLGAEGN